VRLGSVLSLREFHRVNPVLLHHNHLSSVVQFLDDCASAGKCLDLAFLIQSGEKGIVAQYFTFSLEPGRVPQILRHVVHQRAGPIPERRSDNFREIRC